MTLIVVAIQRFFRTKIFLSIDNQNTFEIKLVTIANG